MIRHQDHLRAAVILLFCLLNIGFGLYSSQPPLALGGVLGLCYVLLMVTGRTSHGHNRRLPEVVALQAALSAPGGAPLPND